ncbi:hypothetical protein [Gordonia sp. GAMMA]|uniref:hypothetical protein n=1 Tax=Gordonia sp. GAMMA TaxID=2502241 RepID=UPI0010F601FC|nr:hypothetical protein [Gordonia sp. GAMMA]
MADRTCFQLRIANCPAGEVSEILDIIDEYDLGGEDAADGVLVIGTTYLGQEIRCGSAEDIATSLQERSPGASWECWEDPKYEWMGRLFRFTPELGLFGTDCDADGVARFTPQDVHSLVNLPNTLDEPTQARALGELHTTSLEKMVRDAQRQSRDRLIAGAPDRPAPL